MSYLCQHFNNGNDFIDGGLVYIYPLVIVLVTKIIIIIYDIEYKVKEG